MFVTGVQTCALPISGAVGLEAATHGDGAAAQPASTAGAEREEGLLVQAGEGSPLHSRGKLKAEVEF